VTCGTAIRCSTPELCLLKPSLGIDPRTSCTQNRNHTIIPLSLKLISTATGFEPVRAKPSRFLVCLLNHSDKLPFINISNFYLNIFLYKYNIMDHQDHKALFLSNEDAPSNILPVSSLRKLNFHELIG
jgi:hypothetical protein